jgi:hypothetical protein
MYLSLPLPVESHHELNIVYVPYSPSERLLSMSIQLNKDAKVKDLKKEIRKQDTVGFFWDKCVTLTHFFFVGDDGDKDRRWKD